MLKYLAGVLLAAVVATSAWGQSVQQSGSVTQNHVPTWITSGVIGDGGTAADSPITSLGVTGPICVNSARIASGSWNSLCLQAYTNAPATISVQNYGSASAQGLNYVINGVVISIPTGGGTQIYGLAPFTAGDLPCFLNSSGTIQDCGIGASAGSIISGNWTASPVQIAYGGTAANNAASARTNLGLDTMAVQNAGAVAITGGSITGMPTPVNTTDVAIKSYVDATSSGLNILAPSTLATAAVLPNSPTYSNGTLGVGATLTAGSNTTLTVDGTAAPLNTVVLVKNQASAFQNGIYTVTTAGSGGAPWVLTRATYFDQAAEMKAGSYTFVSGGATNINTSYTLQTAVTTVGTDALTFVQFSAAASGTVTSAQISGGTGISVSGTCTITTSGNCTVTNAGVQSIAGNTGAFTVSAGVKNLTNAVQLDGNYSGWALQNCTLNTTVGSNLLTVALKDNAGNDPSATSPCNINYRSTGAGTTGQTALVPQTAALSINTNATGATLGATNGKPFRLWVVVFNNAGTNVLALINCSTAAQIYPLNEGAIVASTTGMGGSANQAGTFYTPNGTALASVYFRILGYVEYSSGLATAGTYNVTPTFVGPFGPGTKKPGDIVQAAYAQNTAGAQTSNSYNVSNTPPTAGQGAVAVALPAFTPTSGANLLRVRGQGMINQTGGDSSVLYLIDSNSTTVTASAMGMSGVPSSYVTMPIYYQKIAGNTSAITYTMYFTGNNGTTSLNSTFTGTSIFSGFGPTYLQIEEIQG